MEVLKRRGKNIKLFKLHRENKWGRGEVLICARIYFLSVKILPI